MDVVRRCRPPRCWTALLLAWLALSPLQAAEPGLLRPSAEESATKVDAALVRGLSPDVRLPGLVDDESFLRRVSLDLTGKLPDPDALLRFVGEKAANKRAR